MLFPFLAMKSAEYPSKMDSFLLLKDILIFF